MISHFSGVFVWMGNPWPLVTWLCGQQALQPAGGCHRWEICYTKVRFGNVRDVSGILKTLWEDKIILVFFQSKFHWNLRQWNFKHLQTLRSESCSLCEWCPQSGAMPGQRRTEGVEECCSTSHVTWMINHRERPHMDTHEPRVTVKILEGQFSKESLLPVCCLFAIQLITWFVVCMMSGSLRDLFSTFSPMQSSKSVREIHTVDFTISQLATSKNCTCLQRVLMPRRW